MAQLNDLLVLGYTNLLGTVNAFGEIIATKFNGDGSSITNISAGNITGTLGVSHGGTGLASMTANAVLAGNGTGAIKQIASASGALYATTANGAPQFGTLPVAQGGTGATTFTANAVLTGNTTSAFKAVATASGALYATAANGAPQFGTLPVAQGGTGKTSWTPYGIVYASAAGVLGQLPIGEQYYVLQSQGSGKVPIWVRSTAEAVESTIVRRNSSGNFSAGTITATLSGLATVSSKQRIELTDPTSAKNYNVLFSTGHEAGEDYLVRANDGFKYRTLNGTSTAKGYSILVLGNELSGEDTIEAGNKYGGVRIYSAKNGYANIYYTTTTSNTTHYLPTSEGTLLNTATTTWSGMVPAEAKVGVLTINNSVKNLYDLFISAQGTTFASASITDLNNIKSASIYYAKTSNEGNSTVIAHAPWDSAGYRLITFVGYNAASSYGWQLATSSTQMFWRFMGSNNGSPSDWYSWVKFKYGTAVGSSTVPICLTADGVPTAGSTYAGGTNVTLNGSPKGGSTASFYAPTSAGTANYMLISNGSGAPSWTSTIPNGTLPLRLRTYQATATSTNANDATESGFHYIGSNGTNRPPFTNSTTYDYRILTTAYSTSQLQQIATDYRCNEIYYRRNENGTWKNWVQIQTTESADARYAKLQTWNDLMHSGNEFTFAKAAYSGYIWFNYRTASGTTDGNITGYKFGNGKGTLAGVTVEAETFKGALDGNASTASAASYLTNIVSSDQASGSATQRYVFISYNDLTTNRPAYDTNFTYQTSTGTLSTPKIKISGISAPTASGGTTYGTGSNGQVLKSNGSGGVYWASDSNTNTQIRVYRQTGDNYNDDYPILVSRTATSSIGTAGSNSSYSAVYGVIGGDGANTPTINPKTGTIKTPGYVCASWLYTSAASEVTSASKIAVIEPNGYIYWISPSNLVGNSKLLMAGDKLTSDTVDSALESSASLKINTADSTVYDNNDGMILTATWSSAYGAQIWLDDGSGGARMAIRNRASNAWNGWREVLTSGNYSSYALPLSGGTMTGSIKRSSFVGSWVAACNGDAIINSTITPGQFSPMCSAGTTNGRMVLAFYQGQLQVCYITKANCDSSSNTIAKAAVLFDESGNASWSGGTVSANVLASASYVQATTYLKSTTYTTVGTYLTAGTYINAGTYLRSANCGTSAPSSTQNGYNQKGALYFQYV